MKNFLSSWRPRSRWKAADPRRWRRTLQVELLEDRRLLSLGGAGMGLTVSTLGQAPLSFEANQGQVDGRIDFQARGEGYAVFLTPAEAVLSLTPDGSAESVLRVQLVGGNPAAAATGQNLLDGKVNYLIGDDPTGWHTDIPTYGRVEYQEVYPGVDLVYYGNGERLEYDFVLAPGADPGGIALRFDGADRLTVNAAGDLVLDVAGGEMVQPAPVLYQTAEGTRWSVSGGYVVAGDGTVRFAVGPYDASLPLTIDPVLTYSTYLGGGNSEYGFDIDVDDAGSAYVTGAASSSGFPQVNPFQTPPNNGAQYAYIAKFKPDGSGLEYATYFGGTNGANHGQNVAVDAAGNAYIAGATGATNFPTVGAFQPENGTTGDSTGDAFVVKVKPNGSGLAFSSYYGGGGTENADGIALDGSGNAWVRGHTDSDDLPTVSPVQADFEGITDYFVLKVSSGGSLDFATYLGGSGQEAGNVYGDGIAVDGAGNAYSVGTVNSFDYPLLNAMQTVPDNMVLTKYNANGTLAYSTYYGGSGSVEEADAVAADADGNVYLTGTTDSDDLATAGAFQTVFGGGFDVFVTRINAAGTAVDFSTYLGGTDDEQAYGLDLDAAGQIFVSGVTSSMFSDGTDVPFPTVNPLQPFGLGTDDGFVSQLNAAGSSLIFSTPLGDDGNDPSNGVAVDGAGNIYVMGFTQSEQFITTAGAFDQTYGGSTDTYVVKIAPSLGPQGSLQFSAASYSQGEDGGTATITVTRTGGSTGQVTVHYATSDGSALEGEDYDAASGTLTFNNGDTSETFTVALTPDLTVEGDETVNLTLSAPTDGAILGDPRTAVLTVVNDDPKVSFQLAGSSGAESAGRVKVILELSAPAKRKVKVSYAVTGGSAAAGTDYKLAAGTKAFLPGQTVRKFRIRLLKDTLDEADETVEITLSNPVNGGLGAITVHTFTITDDDPAPGSRLQAAYIADVGLPETVFHSRDRRRRGGR